tara:strand:+ start:5449 stop:6360 length:912 start_codon:yes stop_codon:yes gene_type:complete
VQNSLRENYLKEGYIIFKSLISNYKINKILEELEIFKKKNKLYYSQSEHNWRKIKSDLDKFGLLECSFENFTDLPWGLGLSKAGREILQSKEILDALRKITNYKDFCMWQNMFFDKSTGTIDHIDTWYLDTNPMGNLVGAWIALEDINGEGGIFHVYPKSHLTSDKNWIGTSHEEFIDWSKKESKIFKKKPLYLKKGDLLLWHPSLIHGSTLQQKEGASRKSITAHYHPSDLLRSKGGVKDFKSDDYKLKLKKQKKSMRSFGYQINSRASKKEILKFATIGIIKHLIGGTLNNPKNLMNRKNY